MRAMDVGRQSMYDTFGDRRALFLKALEVYVAESVHAIRAELEKSGFALSAIQNALVTFAERIDLSSVEGCIGLNAISQFGLRDPEVTRITRNAARGQRQGLMLTLTRAKTQGELNRDVTLKAWRSSSRARSLEFGWRRQLARADASFGISQPSRVEHTGDHRDCSIRSISRIHPIIP